MLLSSWHSIKMKWNCIQWNSSAYLWEIERKRERENEKSIAMNKHKQHLWKAKRRNTNRMACLADIQTLKWLLKIFRNCKAQFYKLIICIAKENTILWSVLRARQCIVRCKAFYRTYEKKLFVLNEWKKY